MKRISICALKANRKAILEELQRKGVIEITDVIDEDEIFKRNDLSEIQSVFTKNIQTTENALEILNTHVREKTGLLSSFEGRTIISPEQYSEFDTRRASTLEAAQTLVSLSKSIYEYKAEKLKLQTLIEGLEPWSTLDVAPGFSGTKTTEVYIGTLPGTWTEEALYELLADFAPIDAYAVSQLKEQTGIYIMCLKEYAEKLYDVLRANGFARPAISSSRVPAEQLAEYKQQLEVLDEEISNAIHEIESFEYKRDDLKFYRDYESMRQEKYGVINRLVQSEHTFVLTGYITERDSEALKSALEAKYDISVLIETPSEEDEPPIVFSNNGFARPLESITESYSPPGKHELDPTFAMSLFYYMLFGLMFSDAGYGLILTIATTILLAKYKNMESGMRNFLRMFQFCGISTTFWGIIFGSYFGDIFYRVSITFFGTEFNVDPLWFSPNEDPMRMLVFSMVIGLIHIFGGLIMNFIQACKNKDVFGGFCDGIIWIVLLCGCALTLMSTSTFMNIIGGGEPISGPLAEAGKWMAIIGALGVLLTGGRESKSIGGKLALGAYGLYGITSYLSDILSYSRLLALGLATGIIGNVINQMAAMPGSGIVKVILFTIIFVFGHTLNFLINILGAYVHTNRLQYVEFFGKFFNGGGHMFDPFTAKTKYIKIKEI